MVLEWGPVPNVDRVNSNYMKDVMQPTEYDRIIRQLQTRPGDTARVQVGLRSRSSVGIWKARGAMAVARRNPKDTALFDVYAWWPVDAVVPADPAPVKYVESSSTVHRPVKDFSLEYKSIPAVRRNPNLPDLPSSPYPNPETLDDPVIADLMRQRRAFEEDRRRRGIPPEGLSESELRIIDEEPGNRYDAPKSLFRYDNRKGNTTRNHRGDQFRVFG